jgi:hypothetical protein
MPSKKQYWANRDKCLAKNKAYYQSHAEQVSAARKARYRANPQRELDRNKAWKEANGEYYNAHQRQYAKSRYAELRPYQIAWNEANREHRNAYYRAYNKTYRKAYLEANPHRKLVIFYGKLIHQKLKRRNARKSSKTIAFLGCDAQWLAAWLEIQFHPGMTWENYGPVWHVDHRRPCASFDLNDPYQQKLCFHWTNLQPLFAAENFEKGAKWEKEGDSH